jgi:hypothetical protein
MNRVRNADAFILELRKILGRYREIFGPQVAAVRRTYASMPAGASSRPLDGCLEVHARVYAVNAVLAALNWRLDSTPDSGIPDLIPEVAVESLERGTTRFLDYLGLERDSNNPLVVVETKHPNSALPSLADSRVDVPTAIPEILSRGLRGVRLAGDWPTWLNDIRDYVRSVTARAQAPRRVVITNGEWYVVFLDPTDAFLSEGPCDPDRIRTFELSAAERDCDELFGCLEHSAVLGETPPLIPAELPFHIAAVNIERVMHGLHVRYVDQPRIYERFPVISVAPVVFLRTDLGSWLRIESPPTEYELPHEAGKLQAHLREVHAAATALLAEVNQKMGTNLAATPLSKHYRDEVFEPFRGVTEITPDSFLIATGVNTHYLLPEPTVPDCPHHDWRQSNALGRATYPGPIERRTVSPRSFFISSEPHHCAHRDVAASKESQITPENRDRCGLRSWGKGHAFCEVWRLDSHLCCRTCVFEEICTATDAFRLPCRRTGD